MRFYFPRPSICNNVTIFAKKNEGYEYKKEGNYRKENHK